MQTGLENASEYIITSETLKEGDLIITDGNINLPAGVYVISANRCRPIKIMVK